MREQDTTLVLHGLTRDHGRERRWAGRQKKQTIVGTASYSHTLMRVRTMSEQALGNRIKAIERAKGQHAVVSFQTLPPPRAPPRPNSPSPPLNFCSPVPLGFTLLLHRRDLVD